MPDCDEYRVSTRVPGQMDRRVTSWDVRHNLQVSDPHVEVYEVRLVRRPTGPGRTADSVTKEIVDLVLEGVYVAHLPGIVRVRLQIAHPRDEYLIRVCP
jgi:hypothetical protein